MITLHVYVQGALMLSEVLREREAQIKYKKKREGLLKTQDMKYLKLQEEVHMFVVTHNIL